MHHGMKRTRAPDLLRAAVVVAVLPVIALAATTAGAQTLIAPRAGPSRAAAATAEPQADKKLKPCPSFGPGFVQVPGTNTCMKVRGSVQVEGGAINH